MWVCPKCSRQFRRKDQPHSCKTIPLAEHFENKEIAKELYKKLLSEINKKVGKVRELSIPCCIHLCGAYDFIAILPKKDGIEVRFLLDKKLSSKRLNARVKISKKKFKYSLNVDSEDDIDKELMGWLKELYYLDSPSK